MQYKHHVYKKCHSTVCLFVINTAVKYSLPWYWNVSATFAGGEAVLTLVFC